MTTGRAFTWLYKPYRSHGVPMNDATRPSLAEHFCIKYGAQMGYCSCMILDIAIIRAVSKYHSARYSTVVYIYI